MTKYLSFEEAHPIVLSANLKNSKDWSAWRKIYAKKLSIPTNPNVAYKGKGWIDLPHWLTGKSAEKSNSLPFPEARAYMHKQNLKSQRDWQKWCKDGNRPSFIPSNPDKVYEANGWLGFSDFLGNDNKSGQQRRAELKSVHETGEYVKTLGLKNQKEWEYYDKNLLPSWVPRDPYSVYKDDPDWKNGGISSWLGTTNKSGKQLKENMVSYEELCEIISGMNFKNVDAYREWAKLQPDHIPSNPHLLDGWTDWPTFLKNGQVHKNTIVWEDFYVARDKVRAQKIKSTDEWHELCKTGFCTENNIPTNPWNCKQYKGQFTTFGDWVGDYSVWTKKAVIAFLKSLQPCIHDLSKVELWSIINANGVSKMVDMLPDESPLKRLVEAVKKSDHDAIDNAYNELDTIDLSDDVLPVPPQYEDGSNDEADATVITELTEEEENLPEMSVESIINVLSTVDNMIGVDESTIEFLKNKNMAKLWAIVLKSDNPDAEVVKLEKYLATV